MEPLHYQGDIAPTGELESFRVAARDKVSPEAVRLLTQTPHIEVTDDPTVTQAAIIRSATKFLLEKDLEAYQQLMYVARAGVGVDNIAMPLAAQHGIATVNTPGASTDAVARRSLTHILSWAARVVQGTQALRSGQWPKNLPQVEPIDLSEKTLGIVGHGRIGKRTHEFAEPHFARVLFSDKLAMKDATNLETLLRESDVVSLNVSGSEEMLTPERFAMMRPKALVVNTARGTVINPQALLKHMDGGGAAALDVFPQEGAKMFDSELIQAIVQHPNFIGTTHTAAADPVTQKRLGIEAAERVIEFAEEGTVNPENLPGHTLPCVSLHKKIGEGNGNGETELPRIRIVLTHPSVTDILYHVENAIHQVGVNRGEKINIIADTNAQGKIPAIDGSPLAMTFRDLHLTGDQRDVALQVMHEIHKRFQPLKERLLLIA